MNNLLAEAVLVTEAQAKRKATVGRDVFREYELSKLNSNYAEAFESYYNEYRHILENQDTLLTIIDTVKEAKDAKHQINYVAIESIAKTLLKDVDSSITFKIASLETLDKPEQERLALCLEELEQAAGVLDTAAKTYRDNAPNWVGDNQTEARNYINNATKVVSAIDKELAKYDDDKTVGSVDTYSWGLLQSLAKAASTSATPYAYIVDAAERTFNSTVGVKIFDSPFEFIHNGERAFIFTDVQLPHIPAGDAEAILAAINEYNTTVKTLAQESEVKYFCNSVYDLLSGSSSSNAFNAGQWTLQFDQIASAINAHTEAVNSVFLTSVSNTLTAVSKLIDSEEISVEMLTWFIENTGITGEALTSDAVLGSMRIVSTSMPKDYTGLVANDLFNGVSTAEYSKRLVVTNSSMRVQAGVSEGSRSPVANISSAGTVTAKELKVLQSQVKTELLAQWNTLQNILEQYVQASQTVKDTERLAANIKDFVLHILDVRVRATVQELIKNTHKAMDALMKFEQAYLNIMHPMYGLSKK